MHWTTQQISSLQLLAAASCAVLHSCAWFYRQALWLLQRTEWLVTGVFLPLQQISRLDVVLC